MEVEWRGDGEGTEGTEKGRRGDGGVTERRRRGDGEKIVRGRTGEGREREGRRRHRREEQG